MTIMNMPLLIGSIPVHSAEALEEIPGFFVFPGVQLVRMPVPNIREGRRVGPPDESGQTVHCC